MKRHERNILNTRGPVKDITSEHSSDLLTHLATLEDTTLFPRIPHGKPLGYMTCDHRNAFPRAISNLINLFRMTPRGELIKFDLPIYGYCRLTWGQHDR